MTKSKIHIKPENRGKFTAYKKRTGKTTEEALHSKDPHVRKMAQFAKNSKKWKHAQEGVTLPNMPKEKDYVDPQEYHIALDEYNNQIAYLQQLNNLNPVGGHIKPLNEEDNIYKKATGMAAYIPKVSPVTSVDQQLLTQKPLSALTKSPIKTKKNINWGNIALTALTAVDLLSPTDRTKDPVVFPKTSYNAHQYGTGSMAIADEGITISTTGYKSNSKDKNKSKLRIPSNKITMKGVPHPVIATDSNGNQIVMQPGEDYIFPNAEYVDEQPLAKKGKKIKGQYISKSYEDGGEMLKKGGKLSKSKAAEMLKDGTAHGKPLTEKRKKYFQAIAHGWKPTEKAGDGWLGMKYAEDGINIENNDYQPLSKDTLQLTGDGHDNGGQLIQANGKTVEAEGGETLHRDSSGAVIVGGNLRNPLTNKKFKEDFKMIAKKEAKLDKLANYSSELMKVADPYDKWGNLKFNAATAMMTGAKIKSKQLSSLKDHLTDMQEASIALKKEGQETAENGLKIEKAQDGSKLNSRFKAILDEMLANAPDYVKAEGYNIFSGYRDKAKQQALWDKSDKTGKWVAAPGKSEHEYGIAGDLQNKEGKRIGKTGNKEAEKWIHDNAPKYGLQFRMNHEPWHISLSPDAPDLTWTGDFHPENYDANPNNNIPIKKRQKPIGPFNPNGVKNEDQSAEEMSNLPDVQLPDWLTEYNNKKEAEKPATSTIEDGKYDFNLQPLPAPTPSGTDAEKLKFNQILPEIYAAATNKEEPVWLQQYNPELYQPYNVSFQDRRNRVTSQGRATRQYLADNANAQATLAAGEYDALSSVDAEEFRTNQAIAPDITNKNKALLNEAQLKNLQLADLQYTRQARAKSLTKATNRGVLDNISNKILQNKLENRTLQVYENLYPHFRYDDNFQLKKDKGSNPEFNIGNPTTSGIADNTSIVKTVNPDGTLKQAKYSTKSAMETAMDRLKLEDLELRNPLNGLVPKRKSMQGLYNIFR